MANFTIEPYDLNTVAVSGYGQINVKVRGFWSGNTITIRITRSESRKQGARWEIGMSHASGGRDQTEVACDIEASEYFAEAMAAAAQEARRLLTAHPVLELAYQNQQQLIEAEQAVKRAQHEARLATDPAIGVERATEFINQLTLPVQVVRLIGRGQEFDKTATLAGIRIDVKPDRRKFRECTIYSNGTWVDGASITRAKAIELLASMSTRTISIP